MLYQVLAEIVLVTHLAFVVFIVLGGLLVLRWARLAWLHLPAVVWGVWIQFAGWICPLTPLENHLRRLAGGEGYDGGFIEHYIMSVLYPSGLTREIQFMLGAALLVLNVGVYVYLLYRQRSARAEEEPESTQYAE